MILTERVQVSNPIGTMHFQRLQRQIHHWIGRFSTSFFVKITFFSMALYFSMGFAQDTEVEETDAYSKPMGMVDSKEVEATYFRYQLIRGVKLKLGLTVIESRAIGLHLSYHSARFFDERGIENESAEGTKLALLSFHWPSGHLKDANLTIVDSKGNVLWSRDVDEDKLSEWQETLWKGIEDPRRSRRGKTWKRVQQRWQGHAGSSYGIAGFNFNLGLQKGEAFRFCVAGVEADHRATFCSKSYQLSETKEKQELKPVQFKGKASVVLDGAARDPSGSLIVDGSKGLDIDVTFEDGATLKAATAPKPIEIVDLDWNPKGVWVTVAKEKPMGRKIVTVAKPEEHWFGPTIGGQESLWRVHLSGKRRFFIFPGYVGIPFQKKMITGPPPKMRVFIDERSPRSTYSEVTQLKVRAPRGVLLSSKEKSIEQVQDEYYLWNFWAKIPGEANRSHIEFHDSQNRKWLAHNTLYRGFSNEFSGRAVLGIADGSAAFAGELFFSSWFESLFGWESYYLSRQRWGVGLRHFQGVAPFKTESEEFSVGHSNFDLKYRFSPGVWGYDESWGAILGVQNVTYADPKNEINESVPMVGGGFFWARSMPQLFDSLFNLIPFLRYPKWVDLDFTYYAISTGKIELKTNYLLNFHGKVFWSRHVFGEGGITFKQIDFLNPESQSKVSTLIVLGKFGVGVNF